MKLPLGLIVLAALLHLSRTATTQLLHLAGDHLQVQNWTPTDAWDDLNFTRTLQDSGFHRSLILNLAVSTPSAHGGECRIAIAQVLPPDFYADPYQLEDAVRHSKAFRSWVFGPLDLEL